ncbi:MAG: glycosyltransferase, partial [Chloroflexota bacterium]|nr:glycosyltransferase [Chloroflexota bacterium]
RIPGKEFSYGRALNIGAEAAKGRVILNLSAHAVPVDNRWLISLVQEVTSPGVAGVYGRQLSSGNVNPFDACRNESFFGTSANRFNKRNRKALRHIHFSNSNCALRRDVWRQFKFDEDVAYAEDILWQRAVVSAGYTIVYAPAAAVYHTHPVSLQSAFRNSRSCSSAMASVTRKRHSKLLIFYDSAVFLTMILSGLYCNLSYILKNKHFDFLKIAPVYVLTERLGWLVGRISYRMARA